MKTQTNKRCWVLDDEWGAYPRRLWAEGLKNAGYQIEWVTTAADFVKRLEQAESRDDDIALIDITVDEPLPSSLFAYDQVVQQNLQNQGKYIPFHGQAVGLWLWQQRQRLRLPYAYISSHPGLFCAGLVMPGSDLPEFAMPATARWQDNHPLMCERGNEGKIAQHLDAVRQRWSKEGWITSSAASVNAQGASA